MLLDELVQVFDTHDGELCLSVLITMYVLCAVAVNAWVVEDSRGGRLEYVRVRHVKTRAGIRAITVYTRLGTSITISALVLQCSR